MEASLKEDFLAKWEKYFHNPPLPMVFFYSDDEVYASFLRPGKGHLCMIAQLGIVQRGEALSFTKDTIACSGGVRYSGFPSVLHSDFRYFLSSGVPGKLEGERYKRTPDLVDLYMEEMPVPSAEGKYLVFKRWDMVEEEEEPLCAFFFGVPDLVAALFTLANFRARGQHGVIAPFSSGCGSIISYPLSERGRDEPRAVMGMFDISARPYVRGKHLSFAAPIEMIAKMVEDMGESFLITESWGKVRWRLK